jgi:hydroxyacylglutathione hydrolase
MIVKQLRVGPMQNFVYLLSDETAGEGLAIDSGFEIEPIINAARRSDLRVKFAIATHHHSDHTATLKELATAFGAKVAAYEHSPNYHDVSLKDGDELVVGDSKVKVIYTPGHTKDSICLYDGQNLFTGDTLFIGNCGRTDLPGGSPEEMYRSLHEVILKLPPSTTVYPGHDYGDVPFRMLGEEARSNPTLSARTYEEFLRVP